MLHQYMRHSIHTINSINVDRPTSPLSKHKQCMHGYSVHRAEARKLPHPKNNNRTTQTSNIFATLLFVLLCTRWSQTNNSRSLHAHRRRRRRQYFEGERHAPQFATIIARTVKAHTAKFVVEIFAQTSLLSKQIIDFSLLLNITDAFVVNLALYLLCLFFSPENKTWRHKFNSGIPDRPLKHWILYEAKREQCSCSCA
jgi:hypothetical protein